MNKYLSKLVTKQTLFPKFIFQLFLKHIQFRVCSNFRLCCICFLLTQINLFPIIWYNSSAQNQYTTETGKNLLLVHAF